ncbi:1-phosphofructokinase family hexose kinase [Auraticoccus cholistanensis]|uniref:1-phosphofructokinase family hexose kinase n=1 Tax=Auraticoccus cholistanensis TaxID=2656650 RepID=UPI0018D1FE6A
MLTALVLSPSLDISYDVDQLTVGRIHRPRAVVRCAGGKGLNMVRAAARLGAPSQAVTVLGGPVGQLLATLLEEEGLEAVVVPNDRETRICVSVAGAEMTELYQRATPLGDGVLDQVGRALTDVLPASGWLAVNGGLPEGTDPERVADLLAGARERGVRVAADCYGDLLALLLRRGVDLVKINRSEAAGLVGAGEDADLAGLTAEVAARAGAPVVVTDGARGSMLTDGGTCWLVAASRHRGTWSQGSGDSYLGGLLAGLEEGLGLVEAVRLGAGAATANALLPGPGNLDPATARRIAAELEVQPA